MPIRVIKSPDRGSEAVQRMLASGNFKLGPSGELLRVSAEEANRAALQRSREAAFPEKYSPTTSGFMTPERKEYLENIDRQLTPEEAREYATVSFDPSEGPNIVFGAVAGEAPMEPVALLAGQAIKRAGDAYRVLKTPVENVGVELASAEPGTVGLLKRSGYKGPQINVGPRTQSPTELFAPSALEPYSQRTDIAYTDPVAGEGSEFVRRYFADPQVQQHYRNLVGKGDPSFTNMKDAVNLMYDDAAEIQSRQSLLGAPERMRVQEIAEKEFGGDYARMFQESEEASRLQKEYIQKIRNAGNVATDKVYQASLHTDFDPERLTQTIIDNDDAVALEALFLRGQRTPNPIVSSGNEFISPDAAGVYMPDLESVVMQTGSFGNKSIGAHESQHFADSSFLRSANEPGSNNPNAARKILDGLSESVSPQFKDHVITNSTAQPAQDYNKYLANPAEITARTREAQRYLADVLLNNPTRNPAIENLSQKERVAFLLGDFSVLNDSSVMNVFNTAFKKMAKEDRRGVIKMFNEVIDGGKVVDAPHLAPQRTTMNMSGRKKEAISNLFKYSLATTGAGVAYGSMDPSQQPSQGMYTGGKMRVNKTQPMKIMKQ